MAIFLRHVVRWPSVDIRQKFYGDRPRGTPPSWELNARGVGKYSDFGPIEGYYLGNGARKEVIKLVLITIRKWYMSFRFVPKSVTLNGLEQSNGPYFSLYFTDFVYDVVVKQLPRFQNLLSIVYDHTKLICAIIQRLFEQNKLITRFDGHMCIDD